MVFFCVVCLFTVLRIQDLVAVGSKESIELLLGTKIKLNKREALPYYSIKQVLRFYLIYFNHPWSQ